MGLTKTKGTLLVRPEKHNSETTCINCDTDVTVGFIQKGLSGTGGSSIKGLQGCTDLQLKTTAVSLTQCDVLPQQHHAVSQLPT